MTAKKAMPPGSGADFSEGAPPGERTPAAGKRRPSEAAHLAQVHFLESLDRVNRAIQQASGVEEMLWGVTETTLAIFAADRVWLLTPCNPDAPSRRVPVESTRPKYPGACALSLEIPTSPGQAQDMRDALASDGPVSYTAGTERPVCEEIAGQFGVQAQMLMAVYPKKGDPWLFGMHQCSHARLWTEDERRLFNQIGRRIGDALGTALVFRDLQESEQRYRGLVERMVNVIYTLDRQGIVTSVNAAIEPLLGFTPEQVVGRNFAEFIPERELPAATAAFERVLSGEEVTETTVLIGKDGKARHVEFSSSAVEQDGRVVGTRGIIRDVTERKRADEERKAHIRFLESLELLDQELRGETDVEQMLKNAMDRVRAIFGSDRAWLLHPCDPDAQTLRVPMESCAPEYPGALAGNLEIPVKPGIAQHNRDALASNEPVVCTIGTENPPCRALVDEPHRVQAMMFMAVYPKMHAPWLIGMHQCSHARVWTEEERRLFREVGRRIGDSLGMLLTLRDLRESEARFRGIAERSFDVIFTADPRGAITYASPAAERVFLVKPAEMVGRYFGEFLAEAGKARHLQLFADIAAGKDTGVIDAEAVRKGGTQLFIEINASPILEEGRITGVQAIVRDVTERRRAEERVRHMEARLAHVSRLSAIGEMVAGIAHEVGQPFYSVINFAKAISNSLAAEGDPDLETLREWNEGIVLAADRGAAIIRRLRDFSRRTRSQNSLIGVSQVVRESVELLAFETRRSRIALRLELLEDAPPVFVDRIQIQQVVVNLLRNAYDALRGTGEGSPRRVTIRTEMAGEFVEVAVADNGPGLPPDDELQIFDAFVTTKPDGSGMGLAISRTIVEAHCGRLWATSNPDGGATFHMTLPVAAAGQSDHDVREPT